MKRGVNMSNKTIITVVIVLLVLLVVGLIIGIFVFSNNPSVKKEKPIQYYSLTLEDQYCNIKESKKIIRIKATIETTSETTHKKLGEKQFLIRDQVNKTVRNLTEEELQGEKGQTNLQSQIKDKLVELFEDESITNIYFNDFIIQ